MKCPRCQQENPPQAKFCLECATPLRLPDSDGEALNVGRRLAEALRREQEAREQQTATSEILRVISQSLTDAQPVFDAIARSARRLCEATQAVVSRYDGELVHLAALDHVIPEGLELARQMFPMPPSRANTHGRVVLEGTVVHIPDVRADAEYSASVARAIQNRSTLGVPMLLDGRVIGVIAVARNEVRPFPESQIALLQTFADQAVIAIENVRLFKELEARNKDLTESLEQQTATSEILRVISSSPSDLAPVFETILANASRLSGGNLAALWRFDGEQMIGAAHYNASPEFAHRIMREPLKPGRQGPARQAALERRVVHVADMTIEPGYSPVLLQFERARTVLAVPLFREDTLVGIMTMWRREVQPFTEHQIALVQTFASQAVIAIENVRLFTELQARTAELTRSVGQLTALGEVGRAVSSTLDLETVLSTIVSRAVQLSGLDGGVLFEYDAAAEEFVQRVATEAGGPLAEARRTTRIQRGEGVLGQTAITLEPVQVPDITVPGAHQGRLRDNLIASGIRAVLAVPMVYEGRLIGGLGVTRNQPGEFPAETIELMRTFATQSALAIQNARLFQEIEQKSHELEAASRHKSEFLANMSHELRTPLNAIIGFSEVLSERMFGELNEKQDEYLKDIHASGQHLLSLINDILDLSKIEAGKMELALSDFDLPMTIDNALMLIRERAARRSIELHSTVDERLGQIQADERKIRQVLLNLLSNAIKFTPEGGKIEVGAKPVDGSIEIWVTDTGIGIGPEDQEAVFEEFKQVGTSDRKVGGTGLGLALSRKFIELHGGKIWVKSQLGAGSTFTFTVPVRRGE